MVNDTKSKPVAVLDLDQTMISAEATEEYDFEKNREKAKKFKFHDMDGYYIVFERPGLQNFLDFLFENFQVVIWTAASKDYALFIIEKCILNQRPERKLKYIFFSNHCDISSRKKSGTKDLTLLKDVFNLNDLTLDNMFILDDYDEVFNTQPQNCIVAHPFEYAANDSHKDDFLKQLKKQLKKNFKADSVQKSVVQINKKLEK